VWVSGTDAQSHEWPRVSIHLPRCCTASHGLPACRPFSAQKEKLRFLQPFCRTTHSLPPERILPTRDPIVATKLSTPNMVGVASLQTFLRSFWECELRTGCGWGEWLSLHHFFRVWSLFLREGVQGKRALTMLLLQPTGALVQVQPRAIVPTFIARSIGVLAL
jgi:hypothetical protein